jgi:NAD(P)-dependent dehydrogenase (short-subunit alcohol dehydrogenase family)
MPQCDGRYVVVTGGGTGIGQAIAIRFAKDGAKVVVVGRRLEPLNETLSLCEGEGHMAVPTDIREVSAVDGLRARVVDEWGHLDVLVNNAGVAKTMDPIETPLDEWRMPIDIMLGGAVNLCRAFVPIMPEGGRIVNITSIHRERVERGASAYATAKGALTQYTRSLALELADRNILVNAIAPGFVDTPMSRDEDGVSELATDWFRENYVDGHHLALRRPGRPEEIAGVAAFLAGPDSTYITGETITVDGGLTLTF